MPFKNRVNINIRVIKTKSRRSWGKLVIAGIISLLLLLFVLFLILFKLGEMREVTVKKIVEKEVGHWWGVSVATYCLPN